MKWRYRNLLSMVLVRVFLFYFSSLLCLDLVRLFHLSNLTSDIRARFENFFGSREGQGQTKHQSKWGFRLDPDRRSLKMGL